MKIPFLFLALSMFFLGYGQPPVALIEFQKHLSNDNGYQSRQAVLFKGLSGDTLLLRVFYELEFSVDNKEVKPVYRIKGDTLEIDIEILNNSRDSLPQTQKNYHYDCLFDYKWIHWKATIPTIIYKGKVLKSAKSLTRFEDERVNIVDDKGQRQGRWIVERSDIGAYGYTEQYFVDDVETKKERFYFDYLMDLDSITGRKIPYLHISNLFYPGTNFMQQISIYSKPNHLTNRYYYKKGSKKYFKVENWNEAGNRTEEYFNQDK